MRVALSLLIVLSVLGCKKISREKIDAALWLNNGLPTELCAEHQELLDYGFYRKLNDGTCKKLEKPPGCVEFMAFCDPKSKEWLTMTPADFNKLMDQAGLPKLKK